MIKIIQTVEFTKYLRERFESFKVHVEDEYRYRYTEFVIFNFHEIKHHMKYYTIKYDLCSCSGYDLNDNPLKSHSSYHINFDNFRIVSN